MRGSERDQEGWMNGVQCHVVMSNMMANGTERLESLVESCVWQGWVGCGSVCIGLVGSDRSGSV